MRDLTYSETKILDYLASAWNYFLILNELHPQDREEFLRCIHAAQKIIMARPFIYELDASMRPKNEERGHPNIVSDPPMVENVTAVASGPVFEELEKLWGRNPELKMFVIDMGDSTGLYPPAAGRYSEWRRGLSRGGKVVWTLVRS